MARIFLDANESRNGALAANDTVFGNTGTENVTINTGATTVRIEGTIEGVALANAPASYTFLAQGNNLVVFSAGVEVARIIVQDDANGTQLTFPGGSTTVNVGAGGMTIGGTAVPTGTAAPVTPGNLNPDTQLTAALEALATAQAAVAEFNDGLEDDPSTPGVDESDVDEVVDAATVDLEAEIDGALGNVDFAGSGTNARAGLIADARAELQSDIDDAADDLAAAGTTAGAAVVTAIDNVDAQITIAEAAIDAFNVADRAENGEQARFEEVNGGNLSVAGTEVRYNGEVVATLNGDTWEMADTDAAAAELEGTTGFDAYLESLQGETDAMNAANDAVSTLQDAVAEVVALENGDSSISADDISTDAIDFGFDADGNSEITVDFTETDSASAPSVTTSQGSTETTETATVTFTSLAAGQNVVVNGRTVSATGAGLTAAEVADAFATGTINPANGTVSGAYGSGFAVSGSTTTTVTYTATAPGAVTDITSSGTAASVSTTQGLNDVTETATVEFNTLQQGQSVTVEGLTLTANSTLTATEVAAAFAGLTAGSAGPVIADGTFTGTLSADFNSGVASGDTVVFTSTATDQNVGDIVVSATGVTPSAPEAQAVLTERADLEAAQGELEDLESAISAWEDALAQQATFGDLNAAVDDARAAIQDPVADGGLGISLREGAQNFTAGNDVYLLAEGTNRTLSGFGALGEDRIYVQGDFTLVELDDETIGTDAVGSATVREAFIQQVGSSTVISFEDEAFNGSETDGSFDGTVITLTNTVAADVSFNSGYFTIA